MRSKDKQETIYRPAGWLLTGLSISEVQLDTDADDPAIDDRLHTIQVEEPELRPDAHCAIPDGPDEFDVQLVQPREVQLHGDQIAFGRRPEDLSRGRLREFTATRAK